VDEEALLPGLDEPAANDQEGGDLDIEPERDDDGQGVVPGSGPGDGVVLSSECLAPESESDQRHPLGQYFDPEACVWRVEFHGGEVGVGLPWSVGTPLDVVLDDAVDTISGCIEDGLTDDNDDPITDYRSFVPWKGPDVAAVAAGVLSDPSRLEYTTFRV
jgi:hypothetical protein